MIENQEDQHAFTDIISNALAVLILLTLLSLMLSGEVYKKSLHEATDDADTMEVRMLRRDLIPLRSSYYVVVDNRIVRWPVAEIAAYLLNNPDAESGNHALCEFLFVDYAGFIGKGKMLRDSNCFSLSFKPNLEFIASEYPETDSKVIETLATTIKKEYFDENVAPLFFVYPSGIDVFVLLHKAINSNNVRMRWRPASEGKKISIYRSQEQFNDLYGKITN